LADRIGDAHLLESAELAWGKVLNYITTMLCNSTWGNPPERLDVLKRSFLAISLIGSLLLAACTSSTSSPAADSTDAPTISGETITVYSGRNENFIKPFFEEFESLTGIKVEVRYGDSAELAAQILEEGSNSPADVFLTQDAGAIGAVAAAELLQVLDSADAKKVPSKFADPNGLWVGLTGRARVIAYDPELLQAEDVPTNIDNLLNPQWRSIIGIAPANSSFQSFVTALRQIRGDEAALEWLQGLAANDPQIFEKNSQIIEAIDAKVIGLGLTNHYYAYEVAESLGRTLNVENGFFEAGDLGNLLNVSAFGILKTSKKTEAANLLLEYLLDENTQKKFVAETSEYAILPNLAPPRNMPALNDLGLPDVQLGNLSDVARTQELLVQAGLL
jgi:iron(III) transport system substrate-binding protein